MNLKNKKGVTMLELVVAIAVLAIATIPIYNMFMTSNRLNAMGHKVTAATFTAQLKMEELVGLNLEQLNEKVNPPDNEPYNGFLVDVKYKEPQPFPSPSPLYAVIVNVYENDGTTLICTEENIINVDADFNAG